MKRLFGCGEQAQIKRDAWTNQLITYIVIYLCNLPSPPFPSLSRWRFLGPLWRSIFRGASTPPSSEYLRTVHPVLHDQLYGKRSDLLDRVRGFWSDGVDCFARGPDHGVSRGGHLGGGLFSAFQVAVPRQRWVQSRSISNCLRETSEDRRAILDRLSRLQRSARLRRSYFDLLEELWLAVDPWWKRKGAPDVERTAADIRRTLARGVKWHEVVTTECPTFIEHLPEIIDRTELGHRVLLAPCALFGKGLYLELPDCILVGFGVRGEVQVSRARTEAVVPALRVLADPTRLAIFDYLKMGPFAVSDIAQAFKLAQPTVSVHIKRLREAGLVMAKRRGNRLEISVNEPIADALASDFAALLSR